MAGSAFAASGIGSAGRADAAQFVDGRDDDGLDGSAGTDGGGDPCRAFAQLDVERYKPSAFHWRLALELVLMTLLFPSLVCSAMAARYYNHAGFICAMPVNSQARQRWAPIGVVYLRRAGLLYSWGLRNILMVAPILAFIVYPWAGPAAAVVFMAALVAFDRFSMR